jgi:hypothetical protein
MNSGFGWDEFPFRVETWTRDDGRTDELLALAGHIDVAKAAFAVALKIRPGRIVRLRNKARVVEEFFP